MNTMQTINPIQLKTWSWTKVNDTTLPLPQGTDARYRRDPVTSAPARVRLAPQMFPQSWQHADKTPLRMGEDWERYIGQHANVLYDVLLDGDEPLRLDFVLDEHSPYLVDDCTFVVEEGTSGRVLLSYQGAGWHAGRTRLWVREGGQARIVLLQNMADTAVHSSALAVGLEKDASVEIVCVDFGAGQAVGHVNIESWGEGARAELHTLYLGDGERQLDFHYRMAMHGKRNQSNMKTHGVLFARSRKLYRGTLDFIRGCSGSKGSEEENTILMSPNIRQQSVPLLLCGEDNVEGAHAASTGKIDENKLFYLMSRGLSELQARKLIVEAAFLPTLQRIGQPETEELLMEQVRRKLDHV